MRNLVLNFQILAIKIEHFINCYLENNLQILVILTNFVNIRTSKAYKKKLCLCQYSLCVYLLFI